MLIALGIFLYVVYVVLATKALLISPKLRMSLFTTFVVVIFSLPILPQVVIGRWCYNKWITVSAVLVLILALICIFI